MIIPLNTQKSMSRWILKKFKKMGEKRLCFSEWMTDNI